MELKTITSSDEYPHVGVLEATDPASAPLSGAGGFRAFYRKAVVQIILVSFVCFCCPGMFNALSGLGGGGKADAKTADNGNVALYSTFAVFGFFGGTIVNKIGPRYALAIGSLGYSLYIGAIYSTVISQVQARENFVIAAGAILGACAGILWTAQGAFMLSYSWEGNKGKMIALFWMIFNLGAVVGAAIPLGQNWNKASASSVDGNTYIAFLVITLIGACLPLFLVDPSLVIRADGTSPVVPPQPTWKSELKGLGIALKTDPAVLMMFPFFLASNWFYTYTFNAQNGSGLFSLRGRTLNNLVYYLAQIVGSGLIGLFLDSKRMSRRGRAFGGWALLFITVFSVWGGNYAVQRTYSRESLAEPSWVPVDVYDSRYTGLVWLYIFNGALDAAWQSYAYWIMGAMSNDLRRLSYFAGFYKALQSCGAAIIFRLDALKISYMNELISCWVLCAGGLVIMAPMLWSRIQDTTIEEFVTDGGDVAPETKGMGIEKGDEEK